VVRQNSERPQNEQVAARRLVNITTVISGMFASMRHSLGWLVGAFRSSRLWFAKTQNARKMNELG
jgi:hypothetical protein